MIKKFLPLAVIILILSLTFSYGVEPQEVSQPQTFTAEEISVFEKKFREIDAHMNYFRENMVEHNDIIEMYSETERLFRELKTSPDISDITLAREHLNTKLLILREKAEQRKAYIKRMDLMYKAMVIMGLIIIVFNVVYSIYMYARRKI